MPERTSQSSMLTDLNPEQRKAVTHGEGPLLIIAGAGTGKTTVITRRVAWLVLEKGVDPNDILALTFTNKAAEEMETRVDQLLPYGYVGLHISTFHTFCQEILQSHALDIGLASDVKLLDTTGLWLLIRENIKKFDLDYYRPHNNPNKFIKAMITHFSRLKDEEITPEEYRTHADELMLSFDDIEGSGGRSKKSSASLEKKEESVSEAKRIHEIAHAYHRYQQLLRDNNKMDFGDLIAYCLKLFRQRPQILKKYQTQFKYVLVDEFQDTNWAQYDLVKLLARPQDNITVVADDDQSIYRFRGASMSNVLQFAHEHNDAARVSLVQNYRSAQEILDTSHRFIERNNPNRLEAQTELGISKKLRSNTKEKAVIKHLHAPRASDEARVVAETMLEIKQQDADATWNDFVILVRANNQADMFEEALAARGIPYQNFSAAGLYKTTLIANMLAFFSVLDDYHESRAVFRLLYLPFLDIEPEALITCTHYASKKRVSLYDVVRHPQIAGVHDESSLVELGRLSQWIQQGAKAAKDKKPTEVLYQWLQESGYLDYMDGLPEEESIGQYRLLRAFWERLRDIERAAGAPHISDVVAFIREEQLSGDDGAIPIDLEAGPEVVRIMTVHSAKGLEFEHVFVTNMVDRRFPTTERREAIAIPDALVKEIIPEGDSHLEEERRLFYVAMTRAKRGLYFTSAETYGGTQKKKYSSFLYELADRSPHIALARKPIAGEVKDFLPKKVAHARHAFMLPIPQKFSFSQLKAYTKNPFQYKLLYIYRKPTLGSHIFSYGNSVHATLQQFFQKIAERAHAHSIQGDLFGDQHKPHAPQADGVLPVSVDELMDMYEKCWIDDWYESAEQKEKAFKQGKSRLRDFYTHLKESGKLPQIKALERAFSIKVGGYTIIGRMDRVDLLENGYVRIVDYKTGNFANKINAGGLIKEKLDRYQLLLYQIVAEEVFGERVFELVYHYIDAENVATGENQISFLGTDKEKDEVKEWVIDTIKKIEQREFPLKDPDPIMAPDVEDVRDLARRGVL